MKAKLNLTGEILDVRKHGDYYIDNDGCTLLPEDLTFIPEPDWQQVRIQAAIAAMQGQLANQVLTKNMIESVENVADFPKVVANASVRIADALIAELQKEGGQDE